MKTLRCKSDKHRPPKVGWYEVMNNCTGEIMHGVWMRGRMWFPMEDGYLITGLEGRHWKGPFRGITNDDRKNYSFLKI